MNLQRRPLVLVIDDYEDAREMYAMYFSTRGCATTTASDGDEGVAKALACNPDIILLDLGMPRVDGWEVARRLRSDPRTRAIPIVAVSAHSETSARMRAVSAGVDLFVAKPVAPADLFALVGPLASRHGRPIA